MIKSLVGAGNPITLETLRIAAENNQIEVVKYLILINTDNFHDFRDMIIDAAEKGFDDLAKYLMSWQLDHFYPMVNETINACAERGNLELIKYIVESYMSYIRLDRLILEKAGGNGHAHIVSYLLELGVNYEDKIDAAIRSAALNYHMEIVENLVMEKYKLREVKIEEPIKLIESPTSNFSERFLKYKKWF